MAIICDNDMEIILRGNEEEVIRKMLKDRLFALVKMPAKKPEEHTSKCSSSVFVGSINNWFVRSFAIRSAGTKTLYEDCEYYLTIYDKGTTEPNGYFDATLKSKKDLFLSITYPTVDEMLSFLNDKDLVLITNWMQYGNFENFKVKDFLKDILFLWEDSESDYIPMNDSCDIRIYLTREEGDSTNQDNSFHTEDVRDFDIRRRTVDLLEGISKKYFSRDKNYPALYYSAEFETQQKDIQAAYFVTRFHSNLKWDADPVNIVIARIAVFILPGNVPNDKVMSLPADKKTKNLVNGAEYMIDSLHFNSDIFYNLTEFEEYLDNYFCYIQYD